MPAIRQTAHVGLLLTTGVVGAFLCIELLFRILPVSGLNDYAADPTADWPVHHLVPNLDYVHSTAWYLTNVRRGHINNMGYVSPIDYSARTGGIAIFGDSYVESTMNDYRNTVQGTLPRLLTSPRNVMNFGMSGSSLPDYLGVGALVAQRFQPDWAVILITSGDFIEGFRADDGHYLWRPESSSLIWLEPVQKRGPVLKAVRQIAIVRYVRNNLRMTTHHFFASHGAGAGAEENRAACREESLDSESLQLVYRYVALLPRVLNLSNSHIILVFDSDRSALYAGRSADMTEACPSVDRLALTKLRTLAAAAGIQTIDTAPLFQRYFHDTHRRLDYTPLDYHWNAAAHWLVANSVAVTINADECLGACGRVTVAPARNSP